MIMITSTLWFDVPNRAIFCYYDVLIGFIAVVIILAGYNSISLRHIHQILAN